MTTSPRRSPSASIIKRRAARLAFVQYIYQQKLEGGPKPIQRYSDDIAARVLEQDAEDPSAEPDFKFLRKLLEGFAPEQAAVQNRLTAQMAKGRAFDRVSPMMQSLLEEKQDILHKIRMQLLSEIMHSSVMVQQVLLPSVIMPVIQHRVGIPAMQLLSVQRLDILHKVVWQSLSEEKHSVPMVQPVPLPSVIKPVIQHRAELLATLLQ